MLESSRFDCLACSACHGAARATGRKAAERTIGSMDMMRGGDESRRGLLSIPWNTSGAERLPRHRRLFKEIDDARTFYDAHASPNRKDTPVLL